jgi:hypothetical protein
MPPPNGGENKVEATLTRSSESTKRQGPSGPCRIKSSPAAQNAEKQLSICNSCFAICNQRCRPLQIANYELQSAK